MFVGATVVTRRSFDTNALANDLFLIAVESEFKLRWLHEDGGEAPMKLVNIEDRLSR